MRGTSNKGATTPLSTEEQERKLRATMGGYARAAQHSQGELREYARRGIIAVIARRIDPDGALERRDPAEFSRRFEAALREHMTNMSRKRLESAPDKRMNYLKKLATLVLFSACPDCNAEAGLTIPVGVRHETCLKHFFAATRSAYDGVLDDAQSRLAV